MSDADDYRKEEERFTRELDDRAHFGEAAEWERRLRR
jgi:hypothetical protein